MLERHLGEGEDVPFKGSMIVYTGKSAEDIREAINGDIYAKSGVWDLEKAQIIPVSAVPSSMNMLRCVYLQIFSQVCFGNSQTYDLRDLCLALLVSSLKLDNSNKINLDIYPSRKLRDLRHRPSRLMRKGRVIHLGEFRHDVRVVDIHLSK